MRGWKSVVLAVALCLAPAAAFAQATLAGVVKDSSGAVLPGVTVEASSPVLIEKARNAVTDGSGRYQIVDLRPGSYSVTFTLSGFSVVKRDGVVLSGTLTTNLDADLRVGNLQETITVAGETPTVDVQTATREAVVAKDVIDALPTSRNSFSLGILIPGMNVRNAFGSVTDVGGANGPDTLALGIHGGKTEDQRLLMNGVALSTMIGGGWGGGAIPNATGLAEIAYDYAAVDASISTGGVRVNFIPRDGGNKFSGTIAGNIATDGLQPDTIVDVDRSGTVFRNNRASTVKENGEINPGFGGPLKRDKMWFFLSGRYQVANTFVTGMFLNKNAGNPNAFTYDPDLSQPATYNRDWHVYQGRLTWQAAQKHKIGITYDHEDTCTCNSGVSATTAPEAGTEFRFPLQRFVQLDWNSPISNRILMDASAIHRVERWGVMHLQSGAGGVTPPDARMIGINEQTTGLNYRSNPAGFLGNPPFNNSWNVNLHYRAALSYITGSHQAKIGFNNAWGHHENTAYSLAPYSYIFVGGQPNQIRQWATPYTTEIDVDADFGAFAQDRWTLGRATLTGGIRYDYFANSYPEQTLGPGTFAPTRNVTIPAVDNLSWHDITPRLGLAYDLFGNGKTAFKASLNKYLIGLGTFSFAPNNALTSSNNPINRLVNNVTRPWTDVNRDFVPQCDLVNPNANGECGAISNPNFGLVTAPSTTYDPDYLKGWGKRNFNWEFSASVQHQIVPRVSADVGYFRRWYGNFTLTDNRAYSASDFTVTSLTAPRDPRLPDGGGQTLSNVYFLGGLPKADDFFVTLADKYGKQTERWDGVDISLNARPRTGLTFQGGISTGRTLTDNCDLVKNAQLAELNVAPEGLPPLFFFGSTPQAFCHHDEGFITQVKGYGAYQVPRVDVQVAAAFQRMPGPLVTANYNAFGLGAPFWPFKVVQIVEPGAQYGDRMNQLDVRFSKILRFATTKTMVGIDVYNVLNSTPVLTENAAFDVFRQPLTLLQARFVKFSAQFDW
jgi:hypothetical protein